MKREKYTLEVELNGQRLTVQSYSHGGTNCPVSQAFMNWKHCDDKALRYERRGARLIRGY